jgi:hypothetical protein
VSREEERGGVSSRRGGVSDLPVGHGAGVWEGARGAVKSILTL